MGMYGGWYLMKTSAYSNDQASEWNYILRQKMSICVVKATSMRNKFIRNSSTNNHGGFSKYIFNVIFLFLMI